MEIYEDSFNKLEHARILPYEMDTWLIGCPDGRTNKGGRVDNPACDREIMALQSDVPNLNRQWAWQDVKKQNVFVQVCAEMCIRMIVPESSTLNLNHVLLQCPPSIAQ